MRPGSQPAQDIELTGIKQAAPAIRQRHDQTLAIAASTDLGGRRPQGVMADRHFPGAAHPGIGAAGMQGRRPRHSWIAREGVIDDDTGIGQHGLRIARQRVAAETIGGESVGHRQEGDASPGHALPEVPVLTSAQAFLEAAQLDDKFSIEHEAMDRHWAASRKHFERHARHVAAHPQWALPAVGRDAPAAAIDDLGARRGLELADHLLDEGRLQPIVGVEEGEPAAVGGGDAAVACRRGALRRPAIAQQAKPLVARDVGLGELACTVGRAVIDDDRRPVAARLGEQAVEGLSECFGRVVRRNDDAERHQIVPV